MRLERLRGKGTAIRRKRTGMASRTFALTVFPSSSARFDPGFWPSWEDGMNPRMLGVSASST